MDPEESGLFSNEELETLIGIFLDQASSILVTANQSLLRLEADAQDSEALNQLQRALHTLKGDANSVGFAEIGTITHRLEDLLSLWQTTTNETAAEIIDLLLVGIDALTDMLQRKREWVHAPLQIDALEEKINKFIKVHDQGGQQSSEQDNQTLRLSEYQLLKIQHALDDGITQLLQLDIYFDDDCTIHAAGLLILKRQLLPLIEIIATWPDLDDDSTVEQADHIRLLLLTSRIDDLRRASQVAGVTNYVEILPLTLDQLDRRGLLAPPAAAPLATATVETVQTVEAQTTVSAPATVENVAPARLKKDSNMVATETLRVAANKVDTLMDLVGELVISRSMLTQICSQLKNEFPKHAQVARLLDTNSYIGRVLGELQKSVMQVRMISLDQTFTRFFRVVRDLAREGGKQIELEISGEETELDKRVVDIIYEPLLHLVRNAIDHGIEPAEQRKQQGKPAHGRVTLHAFHQGDQVIIEVSDDGRGIDIEKLKKRAADKQLLNEKALAGLTNQEALNLIFMSGLSTAEKVTEISGRGIGMDVVKSVVEGLKGTIEIFSDLHQGTRFQLRLPLTLAIIRTMLFSIEDQVFAVPLSSVLEITRPHESKINQIGKHKVLNLRDTIYSLVELDQFLLNKARLEPLENPFVLITGLGERRIGLLVDRVLGEREVVVKAVDKDWITSDLISGASILGDGRVVLIVDIAALLRRATFSVGAKS